MSTMALFKEALTWRERKKALHVQWEVGNAFNG
jgi:hypothetical protein